MITYKPVDIAMIETVYSNGQRIGVIECRSGKFCFFPDQGWIGMSLIYYDDLEMLKRNMNSVNFYKHTIYARDLALMKSRSEEIDFDS